MNKNYLNFLIKTKKSLITFVMSVYALMYLATYLFFGVKKNETLCLAVITIVAFCLTATLVVIMFSYVHNKKAVDVYFSLPISRKETLITTIAFICLVIIVPLFIGIIVTTLLMILKGYVYINYLAILIYLLVCVVSIVVTVCLITSIYLQANSVLDGGVLIVAYLVLPAFIGSFITSFVNTYVFGFEMYDLQNFFNLTSIIYTSAFNLMDIADLFNSQGIILHSIKFYAMNIVIKTIISVYFLKKDFVDRKTERAESISNKFLSYPLIIGIYTVLSLAIATTLIKTATIAEFIVVCVLLFITYEIANCIYRRKIKFNFKDILLFVISSFLALGLGVVCDKTCGFGLAYKYEKNPKNIRYRYYDYVYINEDNNITDNQLYDLITSKYKDVNDYSLNIEILIPSNKMEEYKELINKVEEERIHQIDLYYQKYSFKDYFYNHQLSITNNLLEKDGEITMDLIDNNVISYYYHLKEGIKLSIDDLKTLSKYGSVIIEINTLDEHYSLELKELL